MGGYPDCRVFIFMDKISHLYIIKNPVNGYYKIGKSVNVRKRLSQLKSVEKSLFIFAIVPYCGMIERDLHKHFSACRIFGEWFNFSEDGIKYLFITIKNKIPKESIIINS